MWYGKIKTKTQNPAENYLIVEINPKQLETLTSQDIYKTLMQYNNIKNRGEQICKQIWGEIQWNEVYLEIYRKQHCVDRKISDFDWKCMQDAINIEVKMIKYGYSNGKCTFYKIEDETCYMTVRD